MSIWPTIIAVTGIVVGATYLILMLVFVFQRDKEIDKILALAYLGMGILWASAVTLANLQRIFIPLVTDPADQLIPVLTTALAALQITLVCSLLEWPIISIVATASGTWSGMLLLGTLYFLFVPPPLIPILKIAQGGWAVITLAQVGFMTATLLRSRLALYRNRALYWLLTSVPLVAGMALTLLPAGPLRAAGPVVHLLGAFALFRGVATYWLPNVKALLWSALRLTLLLALTIAMILGVLLGADWLNTRVPLSHTMLIIPLAIIAALIYLPLYQLFQRLAAYLLGGVGFDPAQALRDYSQTIGTVLDLEQLAAIAVETVAQAFDVRRGALLVTMETERGGLELQPVPGRGEVSRETIEFEPISPILARFREQDAPLLQYEVQHHPALRAAAQRERDWLRQLEMEVYLPIRSQGELTGILAIGPQRTGEPYSPRALEFLSTLAHQTGVALQNASLFEGLRALNAHITELNENLRTAYERLERLDKAKGDFLSIASHELRTPLTQVRGYVDILNELAETDTLGPEQVRRIAGNISRPIRRLENIINAMMDASQIDAEGLSLYFTSTMLSATMRMAIEQWATALEERKITLTTHGLDEIPTIQADTQRLFQAFSNLISNGIKFTPDGGKITIAARTLDRDHFEVTFADTGIGIGSSEQELIFEKFYRVGSVSLHSTGDYKFKGAGPGLGLTIVRGVIEGHGGCIWVESPGYDEEHCPGSVFHVVLPFKGHRGPCQWKQPSQVLLSALAFENMEDN